MKFILGPNNVKPKLCNELCRFGLLMEGNNEEVQLEDSVKEDSMWEDSVQENSVWEDSTIYDNKYLTMAINQNESFNNLHNIKASIDLTRLQISAKIKCLA